jgi:hypothetical protein
LPGRPPGSRLAEALGVELRKHFDWPFDVVVQEWALGAVTADRVLVFSRERESQGRPG